MRGTERIPKRYYRYVAIVLCVLFLASAGFFFMSVWEKSQGIYPTQMPESSYLEHEGVKYGKKDSVETFLLIGLDKMDDPEEIESYNNDKQADFLLLLVMDHETKSYSAVQISRDTMAPVDVLGVAGNPIRTDVKQIALAHTYGNGREVSCRNTADSVSELLLGIRVDHYLSMTMDVIPLLNDLLGGVEVEVLDDFSAVDATLVKGTTVTLQGEQALTYVRARGGMENDTNAARMQRQRQYMGAMREKAELMLENDSEFLMNAAPQLLDYTVTDRTLNGLQQQMEQLTEYTFAGFYDLAGETVAGEKFAEFYADAAAVEELVVQLFYEPVK